MRRRPDRPPTSSLIPYNQTFDAPRGDVHRGKEGAQEPLPPALSPALPPVDTVDASIVLKARELELMRTRAAAEEVERQADAARLEAEQARQQLSQARKALVQERVARVEMAAEANRQISSLQSKLNKPAPPQRTEAQKRQASQAIAVVLVGAMMLGAVVFLISQAGELANVWAGVSFPSVSLPDWKMPSLSGGAKPKPEAAAVNEAPPTPATEPVPIIRDAKMVKPDPHNVVVQGLGTGDEMKALSRFNDAMMPVPAGAVPSVLGAANHLLAKSGNGPCTVKSSTTGEVSLAISGGGKGQPLLAALSNCANAVEHFTGPEGNKAR